MSDVHCLICLTISCNNTVSNENERADDNDYITKNDVKCRWEDNFRDDYTLAFNIDNIQRGSILTETKMASTILNIIDDLYVNFKDIIYYPSHINEHS